jgi:hypothetical protein
LAPGAPLQKELDAAQQDAWFRGNRDRALRTLEQALVRHPLDSLQPIERPYDRLVELYAMVGQPQKARVMMAAFERRRAAAELLDDDRTRHQMLAQIAMAEQRYADAVTEFRASDEGTCATCAYPDIARRTNGMKSALPEIRSHPLMVSFRAERGIPLGARHEERFLVVPRLGDASE